MSSMRITLYPNTYMKRRFYTELSRHAIHERKNGNRKQHQPVTMRLYIPIIIIIIIIIIIQ